MRFEVGLSSNEGAERQYQSMVSDNQKMQTSLQESLSGNLLRYPLSEKENILLHSLPVDSLEPQLKNRTLLENYPESMFTKDIDGGIRLYSDHSKQQQLSLEGGTQMNEAKAIDQAIGFIKHIEIEKNIDKGNNNTIER